MTSGNGTGQGGARGRAVVVLGMHRSGTSALTGSLARAGVYLGRELLPGNAGNERGYYEDAALMLLDDRLLLGLGRSWADVRALPGGWTRLPWVQQLKGQIRRRLEGELARAPLWGLKDPRLCRLLPLYLEIFQEMGVAPAVVFALRHPWEVARSLATRDGFAMTHGAALWLRYVAEAERHSRGLPRVLVPYERLLEDPAGTLVRIRDALGLPLELTPPVLEEVRAFLSGGLRHHRRDPMGHGLSSPPGEEAQRLHTLLERSGLGPETAARVDAVLAELDRAEAEGRLAALLDSAQSREVEDLYGAWRGLRELDEEGVAELERRVRSWGGWRPGVRLVVVDGGPEGLVEGTLESLAAGVDGGWRVLVVSVRARPEGAWWLEGVDWVRVAGDPWVELDGVLRGVSEAWVGVLEAGDRLAPQVQVEVGDRLRVRPAWRLVYVDEDRLDGRGRHVGVRFKPELDVELLRSVPYLGAFGLVRREVLEAVGGWRGRGEAGVQDLAFRVVERWGEEAVGHVGEVLLHRLEVNEERARRERGGEVVEVVRRHLGRVGERGEVEGGPLPLTCRVRYEEPEGVGVSVLLVVGEGEDPLPVLEGVLGEGSVGEVLVGVCGGLEEAVGLRLQELAAAGKVRPFALQGRNRPAAGNALAREARYPYLLLLDAQVDPAGAGPGWVARLLAQAARPGVAGAGPRVADGRGRLRWGPRCLGLKEEAASLGEGRPLEEAGPLGRWWLAQEASALFGGCLLVERARFLEAGGADEGLPSAWDVDLCLRLRAAGGRLVWEPGVTLGWKGPSPGPVVYRVDGERARLWSRWAGAVARERALGRHLALGRADEAPDVEAASPWDPALPDALPRLLGASGGSPGCAQWRVALPMQALGRAGLARVHLMPTVSGLVRLPSACEVLRTAPDAVHVHHIVSDNHLEMLEAIHRAARPFLIFGEDDLVTEVPDYNPTSRLPQQRDMPLRLRRALALCDRLVVSTEPLARAYGRWMAGEVVVLPNYLPRAVWGGLRSRRRAGPRPRVGWAGAQQHGEDLELLREVLAATCREVDWVFMGMCPESLLTYVREVHGAVPFEDYPRALACLDLDLAVAPLAVNAFNEAKSNLRILEYGALGWPVVCTDIEPYRGAPVKRVPNDPVAWIEAIRERVHDLDAAEREGERLRRWVEGGWMLEDHLAEWLRALAPPGHPALDQGIKALQSGDV